ncbi:magnesium/cobalt transporter CorA [Nocardioides sp.]|uniref:magnesium/cobalt transporter CorA n=1 Tax=Nocardioides sp. TaxID=35761 RepID=UPI002D80B3A2|nr:magnesium/cobalt transporter CorA [Nocardioides sp.]HET8959962.1 magnesium/cobalt transporter CorA [Nocardioides sp.]
MIVDNALYREGVRVPVDCEISDLSAVRERCGPEDFVWVGLHEPEQSELDAVAEVFDLHTLAVEDAVKAHQRPKLERYGDSLFLILKTLWYVDEEDAVETGEINMFVGSDFVITVRHGEGGALHQARLALEDREQVLVHGPSAVVYAVCDQVVDAYERVVESLQEDVDEVEISVFSEERTNDAARIYVLRRELAEVRRAVMPLREPVNRFTTGVVRGVDPEAGPYFRDVGDHLARVSETVDSLDSLLSTAFDAHLAQITVRQNDDMRRISAMIGLIAAPALIGAIYGMNFVHMPELEWVFGYPMALMLMALTSLTVWIISKRSGWL